MKAISRRRALALGGGIGLGGAAAVAGIGSADASTSWQRLVVVTANIGRDHKDQRERAIRDIRHAVTVNGVTASPLVGWQEINEGDGDNREAKWINKYFGPKFENIFEHDKSAHMVPMSIPKAYTIVQRRNTFVHGGKAGVSPHRVITQAVLQRADDPGIRFVFANTHYVAGAFNGRKDKYEAWRDKMWHRTFVKHRDDVLAYWRAKGFPVIWTGDVNRSPMPLLLPKHEKRAFKSGIDQIGWVPGSNGTQLRLVRTKTVPTHVDGHGGARVAVMQIRRAG